MGPVKLNDCNLFRRIGIKELDYFSGNILYSKVLIREAGNHYRNSNELVGDLTQRIIACSLKSNQLKLLNSKSQGLIPQFIYEIPKHLGKVRLGKIRKPAKRLKSSRCLRDTPKVSGLAQKGSVLGRNPAQQRRLVPRRRSKAGRRVCG
jgi:hypothetical protein